MCLIGGVEGNEHLGPGNILYYRTFHCLWIDSFSKHLISTYYVLGNEHVISPSQQAFRPCICYLLLHNKLPQT